MNLADFTHLADLMLRLKGGLNQIWSSESLHSNTTSWQIPNIHAFVFVCIFSCIFFQLHFSDFFYVYEYLA